MPELGTPTNAQLQAEYIGLRIQNVGRDEAIDYLADTHDMPVLDVRCIVDKKRIVRESEETAKAEVVAKSPLPNMADEDATTYATSTLYRDGEEVLKWVKRTRNNDRKAAEEMISALAEELPRLDLSVLPKVNFRDDVIAVYPMGDPHFGMFAWGEESGDDFDLKIAEHDLCAAVARLVDTVPSCEEALIINLGDFFHADNSEGRTAKSGHILDTDTRWAKVLRVGIKAIRQCIESALTKHKHVTVINAIGNHDEHSAMFLSVALSNIYENEPRVTIISNPTIKHYYRFGKNLFGVHHGHTIKMQDLPLQMACDRPQDWSDTEYRFFFTGHIHHDSKKEFGGIIVESFRTLAAKDAWHSSMGYRSGRDMKSILFHRNFGEIERHTVSVGMCNGA